MQATKIVKMGSGKHYLLLKIVFMEMLPGVHGVQIQDAPSWL